MSSVNVLFKYSPVWAAIVLSGCTVLGPEFTAPAPQVPAAWGEAAGPLASQEDLRIRRWWQAFNDPQLDQLVDRALANNQDLAIAGERVLQARAERRVVASRLGPTLSAGAGGQAFRSSPQVEWPQGIGRSRTWEAGLDASWELDVFGGNRRALQAADAQAAAVQAQRHGLQLSLLAEVASDYAQLRCAQARRLIAEDNVANLRASERLASLAVERGLGTRQELLQARAEREAADAVPPLLDAQVARMMHALGVLLGGYPQDLRAALAQVRPTLPVAPTLPMTLPSQVIAQRPDVRVAQLQWAAANARIGVAMADRFPHFSIPLSLGTTATQLSDLFSSASLVWSVGLNASQSLYDGGRRDAAVSAAQAEARAASLGYQRTVRVALREVEDSLSDLQAERRRQAALAAAVADSQQALDQAAGLYRNGVASYLPVLTAQRAAYQARDAQALGHLASVEQAISLYKALGAGWQALTPGDH